jgi:dihydroneopterin aldolase
MLFTIAVNGIAVRGRHGVLAAERANPQDFLVDIECLLNRTDCGDELDSTVDYGKLIQTAQLVIGGESCNLLETLAKRIADSCMESELIEKITVRVHKPNGPLAEAARDCLAEVELSRGLR